MRKKRVILIVDGPMPDLLEYEKKRNVRIVQVATINPTYDYGSNAAAMWLIAEDADCFEFSY